MVVFVVWCIQFQGGMDYFKILMWMKVYYIKKKIIILKLYKICFKNVF